MAPPAATPIRTTIRMTTGRRPWRPESGTTRR